MTLYTELMHRLRQHEALLFYLGGDNFMAVANGMNYEQIDSLLSHSRSKDLKLKCGIGVAHTARRAAELAAKNLDQIRNGNAEKPILATARL
jgi:GTP cyclohydrolase IIa